MQENSCEYCGQTFTQMDIPEREIDLLKDHILSGDAKQAYYQLRDMFPEDLGLESYDAAKKKFENCRGVAQA